MYRYIDVNPEITEALVQNRPVVALESTLITHGLPHPVNIDTAADMARNIRDVGAVPAIIAILEGRIRIGLSTDDLAFALSMGMDGGTTVAATMICAYLAGIRVFATGGIGGVHRGAAITMDVSADLEELARMPVVVICAGAKAILDLPRTYEYLETKGVPVVGYQTNNLPGFYMRETGLSAPMRCDSPVEIADLAACQSALGISGGILVANPPPEHTAMDRNEVEQAIDQAMKAAEQSKISGPALTPYLLDFLNRETDGECLEANVSLLINNARLGGEIACAYSDLPV